ncbi:uncharacterized protein [Temnothorax longispinosus]|uniref:uncharacterized protein n=1 Tax=Temnothorax longispinosus TaxID=300112 RepID=UPI003A99A03D
MDGVGNTDKRAKKQVANLVDSQTSPIPIEKMTVLQLQDELPIDDEDDGSEIDEVDDSSDNKEVRQQTVGHCAQDRRQRNSQPLGRTTRQQTRRHSSLKRTDQRVQTQESESEDDREEAQDVTRVRVNHRHGVPGEREMTQINHMTGAFTIKNVEGSIPTFTGDDKMTIQNWIEEFEDTSVLLRWSDLQKVIYGKKMLRGSAKQFIALQRGLVSWAALKECLIKKFEVEVNSAIIHTQLQKRKRQANETPRQYVYAMRTTANQGRVEDEALIRYIIDGIPDDEANKQILYNSRTRSTSCKDKKDAKEKKEAKQSATKKAHCFACGSPDHAVKNCSHKDKGPKCFRCYQFGHVSSNCEQPAKTSKKDEKINRVTVDEETIAIQVNGIDTLAILDTGSSKTILRDDEYMKIGSPTLEPTARLFRGLGNARSKAKGVFDAELTIQDEVYCNKVYVVSVETMDAKMLMGKDLLKQMDIRILGGQTTIRKITAIGDGTPAHDVKNEEGPYAEEIKKLIDDYKPNKQVWPKVEMKIVLKDQEPVRAKPRRLSVQERQILQKQVDEWLRDGIIKPSRNPYSSAVPEFSVIDLKNGFFHVPVAEDSQQYTSFVTPDGQYDFMFSPFGLCNSPTEFFIFMEEVFCEFIRRRILRKYLDDVVIPGKNEEEAMYGLRETLRVAAENGLVINWKKCKFLEREVEFLGHIFGGGFVRLSNEKIKAVQKFPKPKCRKDLQSFLGLTGYFRKFVLDYAIIARPLSDLLKDNKGFGFGAAQEEAFDRLKTILSKEPVLRIYKPDAITELHMDASKLGYGAILLQKDSQSGDNSFHLVYYMSRKTSDAEQKLHSYELEVLATINALKKFRVYLQGIKFRIVTDYDAFRKTLDKRDLPAKVARWALFMEEFQYEVEHRTGSRLRHVDAPSRYPVLIVDDTVTQMIQKRQDEDGRLRALKRILETEPYEDYIVENGLLMKRVDNKVVIALPSSMHMDIILRAHENGHFGVKKMSESIKKDFYIPKLKEKLERFISCCVLCVLADKKKEKIEGELMPIPKGDIPLSTYHSDHLGPMTSTSKLYKHLFVVIDSFSKCGGRKIHGFWSLSSKNRLSYSRITERTYVAKANLYKIQEKNRRTFNRNRKAAILYKKGDIVAIKRTQFSPGLKIKKKFLGPYKVSQVNGNHRYKVIRVGEGKGPKITTTAADYMKPYQYQGDDSSETKD